MATTSNAGKGSAKATSAWLIYAAMFLGGLLLLADSFGMDSLNRWTARLGIALLFTAVALVVGNGRQAGYIATGIVWLAVIATYFL